MIGMFIYSRINNICRLNVITIMKIFMYIKSFSLHNTRYGSKNVTPSWLHMELSCQISFLTSLASVVEGRLISSNKLDSSRGKCNLSTVFTNTDLTLRVNVILSSLTPNAKIYNRKDIVSGLERLNKWVKLENSTG